MRILALDRNAPKVDTMEAARRYVNEPVTHDEADAILLLAYSMERRGERGVSE